MHTHTYQCANQTISRNHVRDCVPAYGQRTPGLKMFENELKINLNIYGFTCLKGSFVFCYQVYVRIKQAHSQKPAIKSCTQDM